MVRRDKGRAAEHHWDDLMEKEYEEKVESARKRSSGGRSFDSEKRERKKQKAPFLLRFFAWCGVVLLCFVVGYLGTSYILKILDKQIFLDKTTDSQENASLLSNDNSMPVADSKLNMQKTPPLSLFYPKDGTLVKEEIEFIARTIEDNIQEAILKLIERSEFFKDPIEIKHVFRNVDTVYLNFSSPFETALSQAGSKLGTLFITGVVHTLRDNFSPITKVRFLVDSKIPSTNSPVDLTSTWQIPK